MIYSIYLNIIFKVFILNLYTLIGPIGAGKTEVQRILEGRDIKCVCADNIVKELYKKKDVIDELNNIFPNMFKNGKLEKSKIRDIIFSDVKKMRDLEKFFKFISKEATVLVIKNRIFNNDVYKFESKRISFLALLGGILKEMQKKRKDYNKPKATKRWRRNSPASMSSYNCGFNFKFKIISL